MKFVAWSGGADSTATAFVAKEHGLEIDAAVYCELMFDESTSAEPPEHAEFIHTVAIPKFEAMGVPVIVLRSEHTFIENFYHVVQHSKTPERNGKYRGFPMVGGAVGGNAGCSFKRDAKIKTLQKFGRQHPDAMYYEGICADEPLRIKQDKLEMGCYPLVQYGYTQEMSRQLCKSLGLLSPIYEFSKRGGCFFCPNASNNELRHLRKHHPDLWARLLEMQKEPNLVRPNRFRVNSGLHDIDYMFSLEGEQILLEEYKNE